MDKDPVDDLASVLANVRATGTHYTEAWRTIDQFAAPPPNITCEIVTSLSDCNRHAKKFIKQMFMDRSKAEICSRFGVAGFERCNAAKMDIEKAMQDAVHPSIHRFKIMADLLFQLHSFIVDRAAVGTPSLLADHLRQCYPACGIPCGFDERTGGGKGTLYLFQPALVTGAALEKSVKKLAPKPVKRPVYRYILPNSANNSVLDTLEKGAPNPDFAGHPPATPARFAQMKASMTASATSWMQRWKHPLPFKSAKSNRVVLLDSEAVKECNPSHRAFLSNALADHEDHLAALVDFKQYDQLLDHLLTLEPEMIWTAKTPLRDVLSYVICQQITVLSAASGAADPCTTAIRRYCPDQGLPCGWDADTKTLFIYHIAVKPNP